MQCTDIHNKKKTKKCYKLRTPKLLRNAVGLLVALSRSCTN